MVAARFIMGSSSTILTVTMCRSIHNDCVDRLTRDAACAYCGPHPRTGSVSAPEHSTAQLPLHGGKEMVSRTTTRRALATLGVGGVAMTLALAGCSAGGGTSSSDGSVTLSYLVDNGEATVVVAEALAKAFEAENPDIKIKVETRPQGSEGDNLVKTRLSTGEMDDVFAYNSGSLF